MALKLSAPIGNHVMCDYDQDVDFWGYVYPTFYALPHLKRTHGKIIVNASVAAWQPFPRMSIYNVSRREAHWSAGFS
jgi:NADP-dependent 3-hydroxy acid dehydrogenase YdfG